MNNYREDRRRYVRYSCKGSVVVKIDTPMCCRIETKLISISFVGACVHSKEKIEPDSVADIELITDFHVKPINGKIKVKNVKEIAGHSGRLFRIGIEFIHIDEDAVESTLHGIQRLIAYEKKKKDKLEKKRLEGKT